MRLKGTAGIDGAALFAALLASSVSAVPSHDSLARLIADRYGASGFHQVKSIHYVFNVRSEGKEVAREWTWFPKTDSVAYRGKDPGGLSVQASWSRRNPFSVQSPGVRPLDRWFVNDQYWLLFPFHLAWDKGLRLESAPAEAVAGKGGGEAWRLTVTYPSEGGYTPGDAYDLFVDSAGTVRRWIFRKGNAAKPTRETRWSAPVTMGPLRLSLEREGLTGPEGPSPDGKGRESGFKIRFTDVRVEIAE